MNHLARRAMASGHTAMTVDLLSGASAPPELVGPPVDESVAARCRRLPSLLTSEGVDPVVVREGRMRIIFDTTRCVAHAPVDGYAVSEVPFDCWVTLMGDRGTTHEAHFRRQWSFSMSGDGLGSSRRPSIWRRIMGALTLRSFRYGSGCAARGARRE
jgi:hypothetical protein